MTGSENIQENFIDSVLPLHSRLTPAIISILESILQENNIDYLSVSGRTKDRNSAIEKISRKGYKNPAVQLTDLSGIRIVLYTENEVNRVADLIPNIFNVDKTNSSNRDELLDVDQIGYRSIHFTCDLGVNRENLPEFEKLAKLKFELQVRTVLQHAWAELSHDRNYKFKGKLPKDLERKLYLYAGLLEIADKGFDDLSKSMDAYIESVKQKSQEGNLEIEVNSITLEQFLKKWAESVSFNLEASQSNDGYMDLISDLNGFGIKTIKDLIAIIPSDFKQKAQSINYQTNAYGLLRDFMLINDWEKFVRDVNFNWLMASDADYRFIRTYLSSSEMEELYKHFGHPSSFNESDFDMDDY